MLIIDEWVSGQLRNAIVIALFVLVPFGSVTASITAHYYTLKRDNEYAASFARRNILGWLFVVMVGVTYLPITLTIGDWLITRLNVHLYNIRGHVMGLAGFLEDYFIPLPFLLLALIVCQGLFRISFVHYRSKAAFFLIFYSLSYALYWGLTYPLYHPIY